MKYLQGISPAPLQWPRPAHNAGKFCSAAQDDTSGERPKEHIILLYTSFVWLSLSGLMCTGGAFGGREALSLFSAVLIFSQRLWSRLKSCEWVRSKKKKRLFLPRLKIFTDFKSVNMRLCISFKIQFFYYWDHGILFYALLSQEILNLVIFC